MSLFPPSRPQKRHLLQKGAAKTCSEGIVRSPSNFHFCFMGFFKKKKKSFCTQILMCKKKIKKIKIPQRENILIPLTKGEDIMSCWYFGADASLPLISSHCFYLLSLVSVSSRTPFFPAAASRTAFSSPVKDTEGRGALLPACDLGRLSHGNEIVCGKTSPLRLMARKTQDPPVVSFDVSSYWDCACAFTYPYAKITDATLEYISSLCHGVAYLQSMNYSHFYLFFLHHLCTYCIFRKKKNCCRGGDSSRRTLRHLMIIHCCRCSYASFRVRCL